jgi:hypothetical protein
VFRSCDIKLDLSLFNLTDIINQLEDIISRATNFNIDFKFPTISGSNGGSSRSSLLSILQQLEGRLNFQNPFSDFNGWRGSLFARYVRTWLRR